MNPLASTAASAGRQVARRIAMRLARSLRSGDLRVTFPDGRTERFGDGGAPAAALRIHDDEFFARILTRGEIGFGEAYMDGLFSTDDLVGLLIFGIAARQQVTLNAGWLPRLTRLGDIRLHRSRRNTERAARENIHAHYDLGNDFFRLWLDETMTYSCAYWSDQDEPLADAQLRKYRVLCEKAGIQPGDQVLEIGSGWGGFAIFAAREFGARVTSITISQEQLTLARRRVAAAGLSDAVDIRFCDYREVTGTYDHIVSIEMFEAVGAEYFATFFEACDRVLRPGGRIALQTISVPDRSYASLRDGVNWIQKYIFPGGMLPSLAEVERALARTRLLITGVEDIGPHYALTLRRWRERFLAVADELRTMGFDDRFMRTWEYYLAASEAGFVTRNTCDLQIVFEKAPSAVDVAAARRLRDRAQTYA